MNYQFEPMTPMEIEQKSMATIREELGGRVFSPETEPIVLRVIHTTADFDYADNLVFSENAVEAGIAALRGGASIVTDTRMAQSGINGHVLGSFGGRVYNFVADAEVSAEAKRRACTRSIVAAERAAALGVPLVWAVGNAPTSLIRLCELLEEGSVPAPLLVVGVPVGFVHVVEAKEQLIATLSERAIPYIVARGRKGGSNVAAAICNALLYRASADRRE
ncbi:MAG TPA: precorrin-8X methylmutase [Oscillospiraceae bacterium]|nr:precorrin-8X methylmutase [Oscillospiraceae bacterium]HNW03871.1 precorrin-8X methylmutase [Oscillospiraceae bacterium]HPW00130.1 precorrin-8X methylmutase [Oscillospiraceae bacterium]